MAKATIESIDEGALDAALGTALVKTVTDVAQDPLLFDAPSGDSEGRRRVGLHCLGIIERSLGARIDEEGSRLLVRAIYRKLRDHCRWTTPEARQAFVAEAYCGMRGAKDSRRWREVADMLREHRYFDNVGLADILDNRSYGRYENGAIRNHGVTVGWNLGLANGWSRLGIDSEWNKVSDAAILLYWPGVDDMGNRRWEAIRGTIERVLNPSSAEHRRFASNRHGCHDGLAIDMRPSCGPDA